MEDFADEAPTRLFFLWGVPINPVVILLFFKADMLLDGKPPIEEEDKSKGLVFDRIG